MGTSPPWVIFCPRPYKFYFFICFQKILFSTKEEYFINNKLSLASTRLPNKGLSNPTQKNLVPPWTIRYPLTKFFLRASHTVHYFCHTRLHLGFSAKLRIWQVQACKMEPLSSNIFCKKQLVPPSTK